MARSWFRHDANASRDDALAELCEIFGPLGELAWWRLLELHCDDDAGIKIRKEDLRKELRIPDAWEFDVEAWLKKASYLKLIRVRRTSGSRPNCVLITSRSWTDKNPGFETKESARERKARSRGKQVTVTNPPGHSDVTGTSHGTDRSTKDKEKALDLALGLESDSSTREPSNQNGVSHPTETQKAKAEQRHRAHVLHNKPQPDLCSLCRIPKPAGNDMAGIADIAKHIMEKAR